MEGKPWESLPLTEAKVCRHPRTGTGVRLLGGSMETGDAGGLAPGAPAVGSGLSALRGSPGTSLPGGTGQAEVGGRGHGRGRRPRVPLEGPKAVESASAKRLCGPARTARMSEARPENAVNGVFRAEALYLPGRSFWAVFFLWRCRWWRWGRRLTP